MLPNRRMARVSGRIMKDSSSIGTMIKTMASGMPPGTNSRKKPRPLRRKPMTMTLMKVSSARVAVTASCEVAVKVQFWPATLPTPSTTPIRFITSTSMKMVRMKGM